MPVAELVAKDLADLEDLNLDELEILMPSGERDYTITALCCGGSCFCTETRCYCCCCG